MDWDADELDFYQKSTNTKLPQLAKTVPGGVERSNTPKSFQAGSPTAKSKSSKYRKAYSHGSYDNFRNGHQQLEDAAATSSTDRLYAGVKEFQEASERQRIAEILVPLIIKACHSKGDKRIQVAIEVINTASKMLRNRHLREGLMETLDSEGFTTSFPLLNPGESSLTDMFSSSRVGTADVSRRNAAWRAKKKQIALLATQILTGGQGTSRDPPRAYDLIRVYYATVAHQEDPEAGAAQLAAAAKRLVRATAGPLAAQQEALARAAAAVPRSETFLAAVPPKLGEEGYDPAKSLRAPLGGYGAAGPGYLPPSAVNPPTQEATLRHFLLAASEGNVDLLRRLLEEEGVNVDQVHPEFKRAALHLAAEFGRVEALEFLLDNGATINLREPKLGRTALHLAARHARRGAAAALAARGAGKRLADLRGRAPLDLVAPRHARAFGMLRPLPVAVKAVALAHVTPHSLTIAWADNPAGDQAEAYRLEWRQLTERRVDPRWRGAAAAADGGGGHNPHRRRALPSGFVGPGEHEEEHKDHSETSSSTCSDKSGQKRKKEVHGVWHIIDDLKSTKYEVTGLSPACAYAARVSARNVAGLGPPSKEVAFHTKPGPPSTPGSPLLLRSEPTRAWLGWVPPKYHNGAQLQGFEVRYCLVFPRDSGHRQQQQATAGGGGGRSPVPLGSGRRGGLSARDSVSGERGKPFQSRTSSRADSLDGSLHSRGSHENLALSFSGARFVTELAVEATTDGSRGVTPRKMSIKKKLSGIGAVAVANEVCQAEPDRRRSHHVPRLLGVEGSKRGSVVDETMLRFEDCRKTGWRLVDAEAMEGLAATCCVRDLFPYARLAVQVRAKSNLGWSEWSTVSSVMQATDPVQVIEVGPTEATIKWYRCAPPGEEIEHHEVQLRPYTPDLEGGAGYRPAGPDAPHPGRPLALYRLNGLTPGTEYQVRTRPRLRRTAGGGGGGGGGDRDDHGGGSGGGGGGGGGDPSFWGEWTASQPFPTKNAPPPAPRPPRFDPDEASATRARVAWEMGGDNPLVVEGYEVYRCEEGGGTPPPDAATAAAADSATPRPAKWEFAAYVHGSQELTAVVDGLQPDATYRFKVRARNVVGWSLFSAASAPLRMNARVPPSAPRPDLRGPTWVRLVWDPPASAETAISYEVQSSPPAEHGRTFQWETIRSSVPEPIMLVGDLKPCTPRFYRVRAMVESGYTPFSAISVRIETKRRL